MATTKPYPLYPTIEALKAFQLADYPHLEQILRQESGIASQDWHVKLWDYGKAFLLYTGKNKSEHSYTRFRNDVERFLLWSMLVKQENPLHFKKKEILEYVDFCWRPPVSWIALEISDRFTLKDGFYTVNEAWRPYRLTQQGGDGKTKQSDQQTDKRKYRPSQQTLHALFTALTAFYRYLLQEEYCLSNPAQLAKNDCRLIIKDAQVKVVKRLTQEQWQYLLATAKNLANHDPLYERNLFVIVSLKVLFLRISELAESDYWQPVMGHFWQDEDGNWWLKVFGKGRKLRDVTVPQGYLNYLTRYRRWRGLSDLPSANENTPLLEKIRGQGGMTTRHIRRLVKTVLDDAFETMKNAKGEKLAKQLKEASSHWLRHTGASMEVERGRALKDLSEDLGHASMATTDTIYVQTESKKRAQSGKARTVD